MLARKALLTLVDVLGTVDALVTRRTSADVTTVDGWRVTHRARMARVAGTGVVQVTQQTSLHQDSMISQYINTISLTLHEDNLSDTFHWFTLSAISSYMGVTQWMTNIYSTNRISPIISLQVMLKYLTTCNLIWKQMSGVQTEALYPSHKCS